MALHTEIGARLDERAANAVADQLERMFSASFGKELGDEVGKGLHEGIRQEMAQMDAEVSQLGNRLQSGMSEHGRRAGRGFGGAFGSELASAIPGVSGFTSAMAGYESAAGKVGALAGRALGMAFTAAAGGLIGAAAYTLFKGFERYEAIDAAKNRLDSLNRTLTATGRAGIDVKAVMDTVTATVQGTPFALDKAFSVATRALASNTGDLKRFMTDVTDAAGFAGGSIDEIGEAFLKVANTGKVQMDVIGNELRNIPILPWLQETLNVTGSQLAKMISDGKVGLEDLLKTIEQHAPGFAKAAGDTIQGAMENAQTAVARLGANFLGALFGKPTEDANGLKDAIKAVSERIDELNRWVTAHQTEIRHYFEEGVDAAKAVADAIGEVMEWIDKIPGGITTVVVAFGAWKTISGITSLVTTLTGIDVTLSTVIPAAASKAATGISTALAAVQIPAWLLTLMKWGPTLGVGLQSDQKDAKDVGLPEVKFDDKGRPYLPGTPYDPANGTDASVPGYSGGSGNFGYGDWQSQTRPNAARRQGLPDFDLNRTYGGPGSNGAPPAGNPILPPPGNDDGSGGKPKLPKAPVVPYDMTLPPSLPGMPQDASVFSAESSFLDARHKLAEKRARLTQLEGDANATEQDVLNARNDVIEADRDLQGAEMRMGEARASQYEKLTKQTQQHVKDLGDIGASIDKDFGISKGLAGIAENITKFIANLAAAPLLGQLQAVSKANPSQGGYGLMGILGAQGAFGDQFTGIDYSRSGLGPAGLQPGYATQYGQPGFAAQPGESARDFAHRAMMPFWQSMGFTVGDHAADKYGEHQNGALDIMVDSIAEGNKVLQQVLRDPNVYGAIFNNQTYGYGHGATPQDYSAGHTGNPTQDHQDHVHALYRPGGPNNITPSGYSSGGGSAPATSQQWSADWVAMAMKESGGHWDANTGNGFYGGLQFTPSSWAAAGGTQYAPSADQATPYQQALTAEQLYKMQGRGAWPNTFTEGNNGPAAPVAGAYGTGAPLPALGGGGLPGMGMPTAAPFATRQYGGVEPNGGFGKGGVGMDGGGALGLAVQAGGMALDAMAPGAGQAAQTGVKLINRAIEYGGQVAGIGVQGAMETLLPTGGSELANNSWFTRILGGLAGAAPALPNLAGKGSQKKPEDVANIDPGAAAKGEVQPANNTTINVTNNRATEDGTGRDIAWHQQQANQAPGM